MNKPGKIRRFWLELAICILVPLLMLSLIGLIGYGIVSREKEEVQRKVAMLDLIPQLETQLASAQKALGGFRMSNGGKENAEWSDRVSQAALTKGVVVKAVNAEKVVSQSVVSCNDYRIQVSGEGGMAAVVGWLDELDQPARCFKVATMNMRPVKVTPHFEYEVDGVVNARSIAMRSPPGPTLAGNNEMALSNLAVLVVEVNSLARTKWKQLDVGRLEERERTVAADLPRTTRGRPLEVKLTGIVKDARKPLVMTDQGVFGEGDAFNGGKIIRIGSDHIVTENASGHQEIFRLYQAEAKP